MQYKEIGPAIYQYDFPENLAQDLINLFETDDRVEWDKSAIGHGHKDQEIRTSQEFAFEHHMPITAGRVKDVFIPCVDHYCEKHDLNITQDEGFNLLKYEGGHSKYDFHTDASWTMYRVLSALIYLNPQEYEGGETYFKHFDLSVHPEKPAVVLFPSNYAYLHSAKPVTKGKKYIFVTWANDLPPGMSYQILRNIAMSVGM